MRHGISSFEQRREDAAGPHATASQQEREACRCVPLMAMWLHDRQKEKREDIKEVLRDRGYEAVWDMSSLEQERQYLKARACWCWTG